MIRTIVLSAVILTAFSAQAVHPQSFNCRYAKKPDEVLICQNDRLGALDEEMSALFYDVRNSLSRRAREGLDEDQAYWLRSRMRCGYDYSCVESHYVDRIADLHRY